MICFRSLEQALSDRNRLWIALEEVVRQGHQLEEAGLARTHQARDLAHTGDHGRGQRVVLHLPHLIEQLRRRAIVAPQHVKEPVSRRLDRQRFFDQAAHLQGLDPRGTHDGTERVVLGAGTLAVEDVVEQQLLHHAGNHPVDLASGAVHEDAAQALDFGFDSQWHQLKPRVQRDLEVSES